ncbi:MAG TPA: 50S ribosomal protein L6 [Firmicutes bacterium]|jgi:large subunit ribosomal protein L6|nr:50S ribosomal protein L6 [Bacillota bacterium]
MSRVGKKDLIIPQGVTVTPSQHEVEVKSAKGSLKVTLPQGIEVSVKETSAHVTRADDSNVNRQNHGTVRALLHNAIVGVSQGFEKKLEIIGIGYKAMIDPDGSLRLNIGYSHQVVITPRPGVKLSCPDATKVLVSGIDRQAVGETAANIRSVREPEPYQGKGIKYAGEHIIRKEGKRAGKK